MSISLLVCIILGGIWRYCCDDLNIVNNNIDYGNDVQSAILLDKILIMIAFFGELLFAGG